MLYIDGQDALHRPVVVLNSAALPGNAAREEVLKAALTVLQPIAQRVSELKSEASGGEQVLVLALSNADREQALKAALTVLQRIAKRVSEPLCCAVRHIFASACAVLPHPALTRPALS